MPNNNPGLRVAFAKRVELVTRHPNAITLRELDDLVRQLKKNGFMPNSQILLNQIANGIYRFEVEKEEPVTAAVEEETT